MNPVRMLHVFFVASLVCACSPGASEEKPKGVLTDAQQNTLDKSKQTEEMLDKANKERLKVVEEAEEK